MKRGTKILLWGLAAAAVGLLMLAAAALVAIKTGWAGQWLRQRVVRQIERASGGRAELAEFHLNWKAREAHLYGLVLHGREGPGQPPLFRAPSLHLGFKLLSPFKRAVDVQRLLVCRPEVNLIVYPDGSTNLPRAKLPPGKQAIEQLLELAVDRFQIEEGRLVFQERRLPLQAHGERLRLRWSYDPQGPRYSGTISVGKLHTAAGALKALPLECQLRFHLYGDRLEIDGARAAFNRSALEFHGRIGNWKAPQANFQYTACLRLEELLPTLGLGFVARRGELVLEGSAVLSGRESLAAGRLRARGLTLEMAGLRAEGVRATASFAAREEGIRLHDLTAWALGGRLRGAVAIKPAGQLRMEAVLDGLTSEALLRAAGAAPAPFQGRISGPVVIAGSFQAGRLAGWELDGRFQVQPAEQGRPVSGSLQVNYQSRMSTLRLGPSSLASPGSRIELRGVVGRELAVSLECADPADLQWAVAQLGMAPDELKDLRLPGGSFGFRGWVRGPLQDPEIEGGLWARSLEWKGHYLDHLSAQLWASPKQVRLENLRLNGRGLTITGTARAALQAWRPASNTEIQAHLKLAGEVAPVLAAIGRTPPVAGTFEALVSLSGLWSDPRIAAQLELRHLNVRQQALESLQAQLDYAAGVLRITSGQASLANGRVSFSGAYNHAERDIAQGRLSFVLRASDLRLSRLTMFPPTGMEGTLKAEGSGEIQITGSHWRLRALEGTASLGGLKLANRRLGSVAVSAHTSGSAVVVSAKGKLADAPLVAEARWDLEGRQAGLGGVRFGRMRISDLLQLSGVGTPKRSPAGVKPTGDNFLPLEGFMEGELRWEAVGLDPTSWRGVLKLEQLELRARGNNGNRSWLVLRNQEPFIAELTRRQARIRQARLGNADAAFDVSGAVTFDSRQPLDLRLKGSVNLGMLRGLDRDLQVTGKALVDAVLRGSFQQPDLYGRLELQDVSLNYGDLPNGLDKVNGTILLYRDRATIEKVSGESGGGKITLEGFLNFSAATSFWLQLTGRDVRVRYPEGVSSTVNLALALTGSLAQSVLSGELSITRAAFHPQADLGSMLARSGWTPQIAPRHPLWANMRLDVRIRTPAQVRVETSLTRSLQVETDLRLRGSPLRPALLGRALVSQGEVLFFGNRYSIQTGEILFADPSRIEPVVNLNLETKVRGVEVTLNISGPLNKAAVSYRSDPPLPFSDIVALLATGRAPTTAPGLVGTRSEFAQHWEQAGAGALVSQAITSPLAGRLQRFLGVSRLKIDPTVRGIENTPAANLTLEQQIGPDITLVYITNLARAQQQTVRLEWDFTRNFSALAVREANGFFGVDFLYKKRFK